LGQDGHPELQRRLTVDHGGEEFGLQELVDALEPLAFRAIPVAGYTLVIQQHSQIVTKLVHGLELIVGRMRLGINYI
jgi:hypothetical protein